jgi:CPA2 family monovalent cation:H+ antiporter-2
LTLRRSYSQQTQKIWQHGTYRGSLIALEAMRFVVAFALILLLIPRFLNIQQTLMITLVTLICFIALFSKVLHGIYNWFERTFVDNLAGDKTPVTPALAPWDAHIVTLEIAPESPVAGLTLEEIKVRERFGVSIALISRGRHLIAAPTRHDRLLPHDHISVIGTDEQIAQFETYLQPNAEVDFERGVENYSLHRLAISRQSIYRDKTIRASGLREKTHGLVVGVERNGERILNPDSTLVIQPNDTLWLVAPADFKNY